MKAKTKQVIARSGRFAAELSEDVARFTESISFDWRLWRHDIKGSLAHAAMLAHVGLITKAEFQDITEGLNAIAQEIAEDRFQWRPELEDVHMNIEAALTARVPAGAKLHTARSRNDQVAVDLRLWLRDEIMGVLESIQELQLALSLLAESAGQVIIPGYTHLQRAQPVYFAHHLLAYVEMLERDWERFFDALRRGNVCPLGAGALAGSSLPVDREFVAKQLGFTDDHGMPLVYRNSMDAVSDRDFVVEFNAAAALQAVHLSRLAEDVILWCSAEFQFIKIADTYTTGSSLMPQKKNPDVAELTRGKTGRVIGNLVALLTLLKGLPMTYNRDLQEDKERLFDTVDTIHNTLRIMAAMLRHTRINEPACARAGADPGLLATELADYLVVKGVPFRQAHHKVGQAVALAESKGCALNQLSLDDYQAIDAAFGPDVMNCFDAELALSRRKSTGSTGTAEVRKQLAYWKSRLVVRPAPKPRKG